ncbi:hypothetical protein BV898_07092 [Hypsibius exemplaris]|uniref:Uncharacterized protein n=1 Tax=Hypsibius exemplaris TaxID=2072580 RepID=A0A1W0WUF9_HYPEX|nr:hypothetical protein BV898_07092 [Hypsibius exemplaris]
MQSGIKLREVKRRQEFDQWSAMCQRGQLVELHQHCPVANSTIYNRHGLSSSEWIIGLKMLMNSVAVKSTQRRERGRTSVQTSGLH